MKANSKSNSGQSLVEFIFIFMIFIAFILVTIQFTLIANARSVLNVAAYMGCRGQTTSPRAKLINPPEKKVLGPIWNDLEATSGFTNTYYDMRFSPERNVSFGDKITCTVTIHYRLMPLGIVKHFFTLSPSGKSIVLKASCTSFQEGSIN